VRISLSLRIFAGLGLLAFWLDAAVAADHQHGPTGTNTEWNWPPANSAGKPGYRSFEHCLTVEIEPPKGVGYFWAHQAGFINGDTVYLGLQTLGESPDGSTGKVAIFSIWNALSASGPGIARRFSGEGVGFQTLVPYDWRAGQKYRLRVFQSGENRKGTQWTSTVRNEADGKEMEIGTITVPAKWGLLGNWSVMWSERYTGPEVKSCNDVGLSRVLFEQPTANGAKVRPDSHNNHLSSPANCPNSRVTDERRGVMQEMGVQN